MNPENKPRNQRIYKLHKKGVSQRELARMYGKHQKTVWGIIERHRRREMASK